MLCENTTASRPNVKSITIRHPSSSTKHLKEAILLTITVFLSLKHSTN